jgi:hypothetical protein
MEGPQKEEDCPALLRDCAHWIDAWLGRMDCEEHWGSTTAANHIVPRCDGLPNAVGLIDTLLQHFSKRWADRGQFRHNPPGTKNWEWRPWQEGANEATKIEELLVRRAAMCGGSDWAYEIPTASGVYDNQGRRCNIDLAFRAGPNRVYTNDPPATQIYAALEHLSYACQWFLARKNSTKMGYGSVEDRSLRTATERREGRLGGTRAEQVLRVPPRTQFRPFRTRLGRRHRRNGAETNSRHPHEFPVRAVHRGGWLGGQLRSPSQHV